MNCRLSGDKCRMLDLYRKDKSPYDRLDTVVHNNRKKESHIDSIDEIYKMVVLITHNPAFHLHSLLNNAPYRNWDKTRNHLFYIDL